MAEKGMGLTFRTVEDKDLERIDRKMVMLKET